MISHNMKKILIIISIFFGGSIAYFFTHRPTEMQQTATEQSSIQIDDYNETRDEQHIKNSFYADYYWLYPDESYDVEQHVGFMLKYKAPTEDPLYVGTLHIKVLRVNNEFAGFTAYYMETLTRGRLLFLDIKKEFRKRGFGEKLARLAVKELKKMGSQTIVLVTRVNNPAQNIYRRVGFQETSHDEEFLHMALQVQ
jgi:ribosomal protein S18 acetylase RimI-like enzyme